jgi:hypothetical protein
MAWPDNPFHPRHSGIATLSGRIVTGIFGAAVLGWLAVVLLS